MSINVSWVGVEGMRIDGAKGLDPVHVYWVNVEPGKGYVTIICYGDSWSQYFGAMSGRSIQSFFSDADVEYLVNALANKPTLRTGTNRTAYLRRIVRAVKDGLKLLSEEKKADVCR